MDTTFLTDAGIDYDGGLRRFSGNVDVYKRVMGMALTDTNFAALGEAIASSDAEAAFAAAHALTGIAGNLGLDRLYQSLRPLVEKVRVGSLEGVSEIYAEVSSHYDQTIAALKIFLA